MYKNWAAICKEEDYLLRLLVGTASNADTLRGLEAGFPHFFAESEQPEPRMPYSVLGKVYRDHCANAEDHWIGYALDSINFPHFIFGGGNGPPIPREWQLEAYYTGPEQALLTGDRPKTLMYEGEECAILECPGDFYYVAIAPLRFIDLDA